MRIIDKNRDFYDFYQDVYRDDTFTFDRRDSFLLTKELMCSYLDYSYSWTRSFLKDKNLYGYNYLLLQVCHNYWLFLVEITEITKYGQAKDYEMKLLANWKNTNKTKELLSLAIIEFPYVYRRSKKEKDFIQAVNTNNYRVKRKINRFTFRRGNEVIEKHIPLLKACGIANYINPLDIYLAFEEFFSLEKTASERREPLNTTDIDRIERHGFDKKTSFRGKQNKKRNKK